MKTYTPSAWAIEIDKRLEARKRLEKQRLFESMSLKIGEQVTVNMTTMCEPNLQYEIHFSGEIIEIDPEKLELLINPHGLMDEAVWVSFLCVKPSRARPSWTHRIAKLLGVTSAKEDKR